MNQSPIACNIVEAICSEFMTTTDGVAHGGSRQAAGSGNQIFATNH
ncbi:MAG: hypothetical protein KBF98_05265 [Rhodoferax sp.]|jgi:hypothetical protein|nr:hypothetical protein [Rhodoferax sp.]